MQAFTQALKTYFTAQLAGTFAGGLFQDLAAEGSTSPYLIYSIIAAPSSPHYGGVSFSEPEVQFTAWGQGADTVLTATQALITKLDENTLSGAFFMRRIADAIPATGSPVKDLNGEYFYGLIVRYAYGTVG